MDAVLRRYAELMVRTRLLSALAASWMVVLSVREAVWAIDAAMSAEDLNSTIAFRAIVTPVIIAGAFSGRIITLAKAASVPYASIALSWVVCAAFSWAHFETKFPSGAVYSLIRADLLASWCLLFVFASFFRFGITAVCALATHSHDSDPYS